MNIKLDKFLQEIVITQSNHSTTIVDGLPMNNSVFDFSGKYKLLACQQGCEITRVYKKVPIYDSYFFVKFCDGSEMFVLHALPIRKGKFDLGEVICDKPEDYPKGAHYHIAIKVKNQWQVFLDYVRRDLGLYFWTFGQKHWKWTSWGTYTDRYLNCYDTEMVTLQQLIKLIVTGTPLNIRESPDTNAKVVGQITEKIEISSKIVASGSDVNGNKTWYLISYNSVNGYVSGNFVKEVAVDCTECQTKLKETEVKLVEEQNKYSVLASDVKGYTTSVDQEKEAYSKLVNVPVI